VLEIRSSERDGVEVSGTADELEAVRRGISALASGGGVPVAFEASQVVDPGPYERVLKRMVVARVPSPAKVSVAGAEEVRVEGSPESLEAFTSYFDFGPGAAAGTHSHFEYYEFEGNRWVAPDSLPLVVSAR
jgi:hypothetical protein